MSIIQRFLKATVSTQKFEKIKAGTQGWVVECDNGHTTNLWDFGGVRYKATGKKLIFAKCPVCKRKQRLEVRRVEDS